MQLSAAARTNQWLALLGSYRRRCLPQFKPSAGRMEGPETQLVISRGKQRASLTIPVWYWLQCAPFLLVRYCAYLTSCTRIPYTCCAATSAQAQRDFPTPIALLSCNRARSTAPGPGKSARCTRSCRKAASWPPRAAQVRQRFRDHLCSAPATADPQEGASLPAGRKWASVRAEAAAPQVIATREQGKNGKMMALLSKRGF